MDQNVKEELAKETYMEKVLSLLYIRKDSVLCQDWIDYNI